MKQNLLSILFLFFTVLSYGQLASSEIFSSNDCIGCTEQVQTTRSTNDIDLKVYPNPAINYIYFNNYEAKVDQVVFFNLVGRPIKQFPAAVGKNHYDLSELSRGLYLIQLMDRKGNVLSTKRLNKR